MTGDCVIAKEFAPTALWFLDSEKNGSDGS